MHRFLLGLMMWDRNCVDHINHNGLDNRRKNLRIATPTQNNANRLKTYGASIYKGVSWDIKRRLWQVQIKINGKSFFLGGYQSEVEAAKQYDRVALFEFKEFACTNFPASNYSKSDLISIKELLTKKKNKKTSEFIGVCWNSRREKWIVQSTTKGVKVFLGYFDDEISAAKAYNRYIQDNNIDKTINRLK